MNVFEQYLNGKITANQLRDAVDTPSAGGSTPVAPPATVATPNVQAQVTHPSATEPAANLSNQDQWNGAAFDGRRMNTYDRRIDSEMHDRNNGANPFAAVNLNDPVRDDLEFSRNYGGSNAFSHVSIAEYDPVQAQREHDITTQQGRYAIEQQQSQPQTFAEVPIDNKPPVTTQMPLDDTQQYQDQTFRNQQTARQDLDYETHYNPVNQKPLW